MHNIIFRADGNTQIGLGHVVRSLALAEMLKDNFNIHFISKAPSEDLKNRISSICDNIIELEETLPYLEEPEFLVNNYIKDYDVVVLDGYNFKTSYQKKISEANCYLVCIDDIHEYDFTSDIIINHAPGISKLNYNTEKHTQFILGPKYALLRRPFRDTVKDKVLPSQNITNKNVFISLGGADPDNNILNVLEICGLNEVKYKYYIVIGSSYNQLSSLNNYLIESGIEYEILSNLSASAMKDYMKLCGKAITTPSTVAIEYLSVNSHLYLYMTADNQKHIYAWMVENNWAQSFNFFNLNEITEVTNLRIDGLQQKRYLRLFNMFTFQVRTANIDDLDLYYSWVNDKQVRQHSFSSELIDLKSHSTWFENKLQSEKSILLIFSLDSNPMAQVRFELENNTALINYSIDSQYRGKGYSESILRRANLELLKKHDYINAVIGFVKNKNIASLKAFRSIDFKEEINADYSETTKFTKHV